MQRTLPALLSPARFHLCFLMFVGWKTVEVRLLSRRVMQDVIKFPARKTREKPVDERKTRKVVNIAESKRFKTVNARPAILEFRWNANQWPFCVA